MRNELLKRLFECFELSKPRYRQIVALRFGSEMSNKDITNWLDTKEHTIIMILLRALQSLQDYQECA